MQQETLQINLTLEKFEVDRITCNSIKHTKSVQLHNNPLYKVYRSANILAIILGYKEELPPNFVQDYRISDYTTLHCAQKDK